MQCDRCLELIPEGEEIAYGRQTLCEECYMEILNPPRACDPWAVYNARLLSDRTEGELEMNETQVRILELLKETGGLGLNELAVRLGVKTAPLMRELAALRHMEKLKGALKEGARVYVLWSA